MTTYLRTHVFTREGKEVGMINNPDPTQDNQEMFDALVSKYESTRYIIVDVTARDIDAFHWSLPDGSSRYSWCGLKDEHKPDWLKAWILINQ